jgi:uncharacterized protein with HEPN domain
MTAQSSSPVTPFLYDRDYQQWLEETVKLLRDRSFDLLDLDNLIEEIEDMGKSSKREVFNRLVVLLIHLLKDDKKTVYATVRCLEIISETVRRLPDSMLERHPHIPWVNIKGAGNVYRHDYDDVAESIIWKTIQSSLLPLEEAVKAELTGLNDSI